ncbi:MAG TPA: hypothetical protein VMI94_01090 [Bryobacteraceae bacterium]|nr:hypothetical protein [Bryobacteraceae bacterium]
MIGMTFASFVVITVVAAIVTVVFHYGLRYRFLTGPDAVYAKLAVAWLGAWLGSPVVGHWAFAMNGVYVIPAFVGAISLVILNVAGWKAAARVYGPRPVPAQVTPGLGKVA